MADLENNEAEIRNADSPRRRRGQADPRGALAVPVMIPPPPPEEETLTDPVEEPVPEPIPEPVPEPAAEPVPEDMPESVPEPLPEYIPESVPEPAAEPFAEERPAPAAPPAFIPAPEASVPRSTTWDPEKGWVPAPHAYVPADVPGPDDYRAEPPRPANPLFTPEEQPPYAPRFSPADARPQPRSAPKTKQPKSKQPKSKQPKGKPPKQRPEKRKSGRAGKAVLLSLIIVGLLCVAAGVLMITGVLPDFLHLGGSGAAPEAVAPTAAPPQTAPGEFSATDEPIITNTPAPTDTPAQSFSSGYNEVPVVIEPPTPEPTAVPTAVPTAAPTAEAVQPRYIDGKLYGRAVSALVARTGPGASYPEAGTYQAAEQYIHVISRAYDAQADMWWIKCEIVFRGETRTFWTGYSRFDAASLPLDLIPIE